MKSKDEIFRCGKCGICIQTCPVYQEDLNELITPRSKMQLIRHYSEGDLASSKHLQQVMSKCLMCGGCTAYCPTGIDHESVYMAMRNKMQEDHGEDWKKRILFHLLTHEQQLKLSAGFAAKGQNSLFEAFYKNIKMGNLKLSSFPRLNKNPFRESFLESCSPKIEKVRGTVLYFVGCSTNYAYEEIGHAVVKVLNAMGFKVEIIADQVCCGLPIYLKGGLEMARQNIENNITLLNRDDVAAVITDCTTCGSALSSGYIKVMKELGGDTTAAKNLAGKTIDISRFIVRHFEWLEDKIDLEISTQRVTYHAPCHERNHGGRHETLRLLKLLPNVEYIPATDYDKCCGGGGTFFYDFPEISKKMAEKKVANAKSTGADFWVTGCPGCMINLTGNLDDEDQIKLVHPIEIIANILK